VRDDCRTGTGERGKVSKGYFLAYMLVGPAVVDVSHHVVDQIIYGRVSRFRVDRIRFSAHIDYVLDVVSRSI
jgi:hypothetical protein